MGTRQSRLVEGARSLLRPIYDQFAMIAGLVPMALALGKGRATAPLGRSHRRIDGIDLTRSCWSFRRSSPSSSAGLSENPSIHPTTLVWRASKWRVCMYLGRVGYIDCWSLAWCGVQEGYRGNTGGVRAGEGDERARGGAGSARD